MKEAEIKETKCDKDKTIPYQNFPKIEKSRPYLAPNFQEKYDYFLSYFGRFLVKKEAWSHFKDSKSKSHLAYTGAAIPRVSNMQRVWSHHMPV